MKKLPHEKLNATISVAADGASALTRGILQFVALCIDTSREADEAPAVVDAMALCRELGISRPKLAALVREGLPVLNVGSQERFEPAHVREWLRTRTKRPAIVAAG